MIPHLRPEGAPVSHEKPWFEALVSCLPDGVALVAEDWSIVWANRRLAALVGREGSLASVNVDAFVEDFPAVRDAVLYRLGRETRADHRVVLRTADGAHVPAAIFVACCGPEVAARWSICVRDMSESEDMRRRILEREQSHSFLKAATSDLIIRTDARFAVLWSNESAESLFPPGTLLPARLSEQSRDALADAAAAPAGVRRDVFLESAPSAASFFALRGVVRILAEEDGSFAGISMILRDDSSARRLERLSRRLGLSPREEEVIGHLVQGYTNLNIASILGISESGVKFHVRNVFARAQVSSRTELMALFLGDEPQP